MPKPMPIEVHEIENAKEDEHKNFSSIISLRQLTSSPLVGEHRGHAPLGVPVHLELAANHRMSLLIQIHTRCFGEGTFAVDLKLCERARCLLRGEQVEENAKKSGHTLENGALGLSSPGVHLISVCTNDQWQCQ